MKKALHRFTALALIVVLLAGLCLQAFAAWPATGNTSSDYYLTPGILKIAGKQMTEKATGVGGFIRLYMVPEGSQLSAYTMTPTSIDFGDHLAQKDNTTDLKLNQAYDFPSLSNTISQQRTVGQRPFSHWLWKVVAHGQMQRSRNTSVWRSCSQMGSIRSVRQSTKLNLQK